MLALISLIGPSETVTANCPLWSPSLHFAGLPLSLISTECCGLRLINKIEISSKREQQPQLDKLPPAEIHLEVKVFQSAFFST